ncbi:ROK family protein [Brevibacterium album]|uniref:ROK family protein n=1 Tax=Brevibacterium album TaxID=417948 RepID=UPI0003F9B62D|nr:ROK family protein [Brevibacterium album]
MAEKAHVDTSHLAIGIDIGGTGTKVGLVDVEAGELVGKRCRLDTPADASAEGIVETVSAALGDLAAQCAEAGVIAAPEHLMKLPVGAAFPGVVKRGTVVFAGNLTQAIGAPIADLLREATGTAVHIANDADAAGLAEMTYGAGRKHRKESVIVTTLGTGIGTALFTSGRLYPYSELGHIMMGEEVAERQMSVAAMRRLELGFEEWGARLTTYYRELERLFFPDLFILGGGISKRSAEYLHHIDVKTPIRVAKLLNNAGIVGAGLLGANQGRPRVGRRKKG